MGNIPKISLTKTPVPHFYVGPLEIEQRRNFNGHIRNNDTGNDIYKIQPAGIQNFRVPVRNQSRPVIFVQDFPYFQ